MKIRTRGKFEDDEIIRREVSDAVVDKHLVERVDYIVEDSMLHNDTIRITDEEEAHLTELYRLCTNMSEKELVVCVCALMDRNIYLLYQCLAENHMELSMKLNRREV